MGMRVRTQAPQPTLEFSLYIVVAQETCIGRHVQERGDNGEALLRMRASRIGQKPFNSLNDSNLAGKDNEQSGYQQIEARFKGCCKSMRHRTVLLHKNSKMTPQSIRKG